jgi:hypothetical protein
LLEYIDDSQPGWVRCEFADAFGINWHIEEKLPVVTSQYLDGKSNFPQTGSIAATLKEIIIDKNNIEFAVTDTESPLGVSSKNGTNIFTVFRSQLV